MRKCCSSLALGKPMNIPWSATPEKPGLSAREVPSMTQVYLCVSTRVSDVFDVCGFVCISKVIPCCWSVVNTKLESSSTSGLDFCFLLSTRRWKGCQSSYCEGTRNVTFIHMRLKQDWKSIRKCVVKLIWSVECEAHLFPKWNTLGKYSSSAYRLCLFSLAQ